MYCFGSIEILLIVLFCAIIVEHGLTFKVCSFPGIKNGGSRGNNLRYQKFLFAQPERPLHYSVDAIRTVEILFPLETIVKSSYSRKAHNVSVVQIDESCNYARFAVVVEALNIPQVDAIADIVEENMLAKFEWRAAREGTARTGWIALDYESIIVHIMTSAKSQYYDILSQWTKANFVDISHWQAVATTTTVEKSSALPYRVKQKLQDIPNYGEEEDNTWSNNDELQDYPHSWNDFDDNNDNEEEEEDVEEDVKEEEEVVDVNDIIHDPLW